MGRLYTAFLALTLGLMLCGTALAFGPPPSEDEAALTSEQQADQQRRERLQQQSSEQSSKQERRRTPVVGNIIIHSDQDSQADQDAGQSSE